MIKVDLEKIINETMPNTFARMQVLKTLGISYQYLFQGQWVEKPAGKPDARMAIFESEDQYLAGQDVYQAWQNLQERKKYDPVRPDAILERFVAARMGVRPLTLFIPWGVRPTGAYKPEELVLDQIQSEQQELQAKGMAVSTMIMPADIYATEVNSINSSKTAKYFDKIGKEAAKRGLETKPWSQIRSENADFCSDRKAELTEEAIRAILPVPVLEGAFKAAKNRSGYTSPERVNLAAFAYLRERITEAELVEDLWTPIKLSMVAKNKDNEVDRQLPRLYVIPEERQFPWLK